MDNSFDEGDSNARIQQKAHNTYSANKYSVNKENKGNALRSFELVGQNSSSFLGVKIYGLCLLNGLMYSI